MEETRCKEKKIYCPRWKRIFDILFSLVILGLFWPVFLFIAFLILITDGSPVFFFQERVGQGGKIFKLIKFRTMYKDAEKKLENLLKTNVTLKKEWEKLYKLKNDPRITPIGKFLRKSSLDELPQFINVLKGEMSVVGPRPVVKEELERFYKDKAKYYLIVKPGITGLWQVQKRNNINNYQERVKLDVWYVTHQSFWLDLKIILKTVWVMIKGEGI